MHEREYKRLKRQIQAEYDEKLKALDMVWKMSGGIAPNSSKSVRGGKGALLEAVRLALPRLSGEFSVKDVEKQIQSDNPTLTVKRASLSSTINRLALDKDGIVLVLKGKGKRPTIYKRSD
jgi:hypothetical protein